MYLLLIAIIPKSKDRGSNSSNNGNNRDSNSRGGTLLYPYLPELVIAAKL